MKAGALVYVFGECIAELQNLELVGTVYIDYIYILET